MGNSGCVAPSCGRRIYGRGLCRSCYVAARRLIAAGEVTWAVLEKRGLANPSRQRAENPLTSALEKLEGTKC